MLRRASSTLWTLGVLALAACGSSPAGDGDGSGGQGPGTGGAATGGSSAASGGESTGGNASVSGGAPGDGGNGEGGAGPGPMGADCAADGDGQTTLVLVNGCLPAVHYRGSDISGGTLASGAVRCVDIGTDTEELSAKRYWGYVGEDPGAEHHSLAEFTFNTDFYDFDWYNISFVDAFNLPMAIAPLQRPDCEALRCAESLLDDCPSEGRFENSSGTLVSCVSPDRDNAESPVALHFEQCDDAYAWSGDDQNGDDPSPVRACAGEDFQITFCPQP